MEIQRGNSFQCFCDISPNLSTKKRKNFYLFHLKTISLKQNLNIFIKSPNRNRTIFPKIISPSISKSFLSYPLPSPFHISIKSTSKPSSKEQNLNTIHHPPASFLHRSSRKNIPSPFLFFLHPQFHCYCYCYFTLLIVRLIKIAEGNNSLQGAVHFAATHVMEMSFAAYACVLCNSVALQPGHMSYSAT